MAPASISDEVILRVEQLSVHFDLTKGLFPKERKILRAVDGVSFELRRGETLGLVGESGCGKSTTARALLRLVPHSAGRAMLNRSAPGETSQWVDLLTLKGNKLRQARQEVQIIFQDPYASLNPRMTVGDIVAEPMKIFNLGNRRDIQRQTQALLREVGLDPRFIKRYPHEFSGGQRQRIGIARALALNPKVLFCDEPVSALDVSIQAQILNLLMDLQERRGLAYVFIAHDLSVVKRISHRIAVMYLGKIIELAPYDQIYREPLHPYTQALLSAIPIPDPEVEVRRQRILLTGEVPSPTQTFLGCRFASRCPKRMPECPTTPPNFLPVKPNHEVACLLYES